MSILFFLPHVFSLSRSLLFIRDLCDGWKKKPKKVIIKLPRKYNNNIYIHNPVGRVYNIIFIYIYVHEYAYIIPADIYFVCMCASAYTTLFSYTYSSFSCSYFYDHPLNILSAQVYTCIQKYYKIAYYRNKSTSRRHHHLSYLPW